jgi:hypothetical protein
MMTTVSCSNTSITPLPNHPPAIAIDFFETSTTQFLTWPGIYNNKVVYSTYDITNTESRNIFLLDLTNRIEKKIYSVGENKNIAIEDPKIGPSRVYWVEGIPETWQIKSYNLYDGNIEVIRKSGIKEGATLIPRLSNEGDLLVWLEGYKDKNGSVNHQIYLYKPETGIEEITDVNYVENPYDIIKIKNNSVACVEKLNQNWAVRIIDVNTKYERKVYLDNKPSRPVSDGKVLAWQEGDMKKSLYFIKDIDMPNKKKLIAEKIFLFDIFNGDIIYSQSKEKHHLYKYYSTIDVTTCLTEQVNNNRIYFEFVSAYGDTIVCVYDTLPKPQTLAIIKEIY